MLTHSYTATRLIYTMQIEFKKESQRRIN